MRERFTQKRFTDSMKSMQNGKSLGKDRLTREFYGIFWNELKEIFVDFVSEAKERGHLSTSQRHNIVKLIEKKGRDKRVSKN